MPSSPGPDLSWLTDFLSNANLDVMLIAGFVLLIQYGGRLVRYIDVNTGAR